MAEDERLTKTLASELLIASRFTLIGLAATGIHIGIVWMLIGLYEMQPLLANLFAFLTAFSVSFIGQYHWTFRSNRAWKSALVRFFLIAATAFLANNLLLGSLLELEIFSASIAATLAALAIPAISYFAGRFWAFN